MEKINLLLFRIKCICWIPLYYMLHFSKNFKLIMREMHIWQEILVVKKFKNDLLSFIHLMAELEEFRSLVAFRSGYLIPFKQKIYFFTKEKYLNEGMIIHHGYSTVIFAERIGKNFQVWQNVTIGRNGKGKSPILGNNIKVHAHSIIIGEIEIGNNVIIGAGSVVTKSVPSNCTIVGNPARIIKLNGEKVDIKL